MGLNRINPVVLVSGAASPIGSACVQALGGALDGGLILVDADEGALDGAADAIAAPPERVSTLAFDQADPARWQAAREFIAAHYGRLDFAIINTINETAVLSDHRLKKRSRGAEADLDIAGLAVRTLTELMRANALGGGVVVIIAAETIADDETGLTAFMRAAAKEGAADTISVNAIAIGACEAAHARRAPSLADLTCEAGGASAALEHVARLPTPMARASSGQPGPLAELLLGAPVSGVTLIVDAAPSV
jgi:NAD(P)-dependent dehydrogenase (short-subunit alcohol dehydrogenase family)